MLQNYPSNQSAAGAGELELAQMLHFLRKRTSTCWYRSVEAVESIESRESFQNFEDRAHVGRDLKGGYVAVWLRKKLRSRSGRSDWPMILPKPSEHYHQNKLRISNSIMR